MASPTAFSVIGGGLHLATPHALLCRHQLSPFCLPLSPLSSSSCRLLLGARVPPTAAYPRVVSAVRSTSVPRSALATRKGVDAILKRSLDLNIEFTEKELEEGSGQDEPAFPENFPFTIIDKPGKRTITLKRELGNETIEVSVFMPTAEEEDQEDEDSDDEEDNDNEEEGNQEDEDLDDEEDNSNGEEGNQEDEDLDDEEDNDNEEDGDVENEEETLNLPDLSLIVTVEKGKGPILEFGCTANSDEIIIDRLMLKTSDVSDDQNPYEGPEFTDLHEALQELFYNYLKHRGITPFLASLLQDYMARKEEREYLRWLKNVKEFVAI